MPPLPRSVTGCARTDGVIRRSSAFKSSHEVYFRPFINRGELNPKYDQEEGGEGGDRRAGADGSIHLRKRSGTGEEIKSVGQVQAGQATGGAALMLRQPMPVTVGRSAIHNWGLFTVRPVAKDGMVVEYKGTALRNPIADRKEKWYEAGAVKGQGGDCYMFRCDEECVLDATLTGNIARFMNHSCTPNCYCKVIEVEGTSPASGGKHIVRARVSPPPAPPAAPTSHPPPPDPTLPPRPRLARQRSRRCPAPRARSQVIFAGRDLEAGEEVTYDYKFPVEKAKIPCHCGSPKCLGVMN